MKISRSVRRRLSRVSDMLPSVYEHLGSRLSPDQALTTYLVLQILLSRHTQKQPAREPMGILLQPGQITFPPFWTCPDHQLVGCPKGGRELLCRGAIPVEVNNLAGIAQDIFNLRQDQTLLIDPTLCGLKQRLQALLGKGE